MEISKKNPHAFYLAGVDEVGRGALAGPVVVAAVILNPLLPIAGLADSKKITAMRREKLALQIRQSAISWCIASASVQEIDVINILQATLLAMVRAVEGLHIQPDMVLVDGDHLPSLRIPAKAIIKGDASVQAISAASIVAKVARDQIMSDYQMDFPQFSFHQHKAYGTKKHLAEIEKYGFTEIHRKTFNPVKSMIKQVIRY
jgi:ribonuclease HII